MDNRFSRRAELVLAERLAGIAATVIGVGAIGRQVAVQLAALGVRRMRLIDFDVVEAVNVTMQGYFTADVELPKVTATERLIRQMDPTITVETIADRYRSRYGTTGTIFCCVDSIAARAAIWRSLGGECRFWADGRMLGEVIRVLAIADGREESHYVSTLFPPAEAQAGRCTAHGTIYTAAVAAGLMVHQFTRRLRSLPVDNDLTLNLLSAELVAGAESMFAINVESERRLIWDC